MKENSVKNISEEIGEFAFERFSDLHDWQKAARKKLKEITGLDRIEQNPGRSPSAAALLHPPTSPPATNACRFRVREDR